MSENALILFHISRVFFALSNIWLMFSFLTPKRPLWFQIMAFAGTVVFHQFLRTVLTPLGLDPFLIGYILAICYLPPVILSYKEPFHIKFFVIFMVISVSQFNFLVSLFLEQLLFGHMVSILVLSGQLLEFCSIPLIRKYIIPYIKNILEMIQRQNYIFILFPFLSYILLAFYGVQRNYLLSIFIPLVLSTMIIFTAYYLISLSIERIRSQEQLERQMAIQSNHYLKLNDSIAATRRLRHDLHHHLVTIFEFLAKKDAASAQNYLTQLCDFYDDNAIPSVCNYQPADSLICHYVKLAKQQDISIATELNIPDVLGIYALDLCVIIGNCLENALEACKGVADSETRFIDMSAVIRKGYLVMKFTNSFNGFVQYQNDNFVSSKKSSEHGIGLTSVKSLAAKYQGHCSISFEQHVFEVCVSLKLT